MKTVVSLDGFLEGPNGAMDWFHTGSDEWQEEFKLYADVDAVLLGRGMYPDYARYWRGVLAEPAKHSQDEVAYARWADKTRHIVFSRELQTADWSNTEIMRDASSDVPKLKREAGKNLIVYGGAIFAGTLIDQGLVDDYHLTVHPVALGGGKPLFNKLSHRRELKRTEAKPLRSGAIWLSYQA
ncbi:MAG TPA: dihydrofolate reductase family protein [Polyangiales bacterium]|nr:dihydrofolate reductase family protein [Polyangiales bacterium]